MGMAIKFMGEPIERPMHEYNGRMFWAVVHSGAIYATFLGQSDAFEYAKNLEKGMSQRMASESKVLIFRIEDGKIFKVS